jgi:transposase InsO family protein
LDFVLVQMANGRHFRILHVVVDVTRECLAAIPDTSISEQRVALELTALIARRGKPGMVVSDNGIELTSNAILAYTKDNQVEWHYITHGITSHRVNRCRTASSSDSPTGCAT